MFKRYIAILGLIFFCCSTAAENRLVIINATLIDALNPTRLATTVIVENGKIQSILSAGDIADIQETDIEAHWQYGSLPCARRHYCGHARVAEGCQTTVA